MGPGENQARLVKEDPRPVERPLVLKEQFITEKPATRDSSYSIRSLSGGTPRQPFNGGNLRSYYPDFVAVDNEGTYWILETKGQETEEVKHKDQAANLWCDNASTLTGRTWRYLKVSQKDFEKLQPELLAELAVLKTN